MKRKCELLALNRSGVFYQTKPVRENIHDIEIMNQIQDIYVEQPFFGYRKIKVMLGRTGHKLNHKKVQRLMGCVGLKAIYPKKKTTIRNKSHAVYPYLLKKELINCPNQAWKVDITYIKVLGKFVYLVALIDVFSRRIMGWNLSIFLDTSSCLLALQCALEIGKPEIINSDQGCQFTSQEWCDVLIQNNIEISMDGKGRWADNIYIERFWRSIKYEMIHLHSFETVEAARRAIGKYIEFYNNIRPHQALNYQTPNEVYKESNYELSIVQATEDIPFYGIIKNSQSFEQKLS